MKWKKGKYRRRRIILYLVVLLILVGIFRLVKGSGSKKTDETKTMTNVAERASDQEKVLIKTTTAIIYDKDLKTELTKPTKAKVLDYYEKVESGGKEYYKVKDGEKIGYISADESAVVMKKDITMTPLHPVVFGETFDSIAKDYGVATDILKIYNSAQGDVPKIGEVLRIPLKDAVFTGAFDFNNNGYSDKRDFAIGALRDASHNPTYNGDMVAGGFPPDNVGVSTDVIWRGFKEAGYDLRAMINEDMKKNPQNYDYEENSPDISFRRIDALHKFFASHAKELGLDEKDALLWQEGDIVFFSEDSHVGFVEGSMGKDTHPLILHHSSTEGREKSIISDERTLSAHYRFEGSMLSQELKIPWKGPAAPAVETNNENNTPEKSE